jgi:hypothetical protein
LNREVMEVYGIQSFNCKNPERINLKRLSIAVPKEAVVKCLTHIETEIKQPLMDLFKAYYRLKENEGLAFNEHLLEHIGFRVCRRCTAQKAFGNSLLKQGFVRAA